MNLEATRGWGRWRLQASEASSLELAGEEGQSDACDLQSLGPLQRNTGKSLA